MTVTASYTSEKPGLVGVVMQIYQCSREEAIQLIVDTAEKVTSSMFLEVREIKKNDSSRTN